MPLKAGIQVSANAQELSRLAAEQFVRLAIEAQREKGLFTVALAGGSTPKTLYELLANGNEPYRAQLGWEKIHFFGETNAMFLRTTLKVTISWRASRCLPACLFL